MRIILVLTILLLALSSNAQKYEEAIYTVDGVAVKSYDMVAYFLKGQAMKGTKEFKFIWNGSIWLFANVENQNLFKNNPEKYAPQYGGYCAWGMKNGYKAKVDPANAWTIHNGKLYLNYSSGVKSDWLKDKDGYIKTADVNWTKISKE